MLYFYSLEPHVDAYHEMTQRAISGELQPDNLRSILTRLWLPEDVIDRQVSELELQRAKLNAVRQSGLIKR
jgi:hypothetical protein